MQNYTHYKIIYIQLELLSVQKIYLTCREKMDWVRKEIVPVKRGYSGPGNNYVIRCRIFGTFIKTNHRNAVAQAIKTQLGKPRRT